MFQVLEEANALERVVPGLLFTADIDAHLATAARGGLSLAARFAVLCHMSAQPEHIGQALRAPNDCRPYARLLPLALAGAAMATPAGWLALMEPFDALRKPGRFLGSEESRVGEKGGRK